VAWGGACNRLECAILFDINVIATTKTKWFFTFNALIAQIAMSFGCASGLSYCFYQIER
jgi:hypothetical protein